MRRTVGLTAAVLMAAVAVASCSSSSSSSGSSSGSSSNADSSSSSVATDAESKVDWTTPDEVLVSIKEAGFNCVLPSSDTAGQVLTTDPFTQEDLGGNSLIRCPDFQVMLAANSVEEGFATLVQCQAVPADVRQLPEWSVDIVVGPNFVILPLDLSKDWVKGTEPADMMKAFGGVTATFGELYDVACIGQTAAPSTAPSAGSSGSGSVTPSTESSAAPSSSPTAAPSAS